MSKKKVVRLDTLLREHPTALRMLIADRQSVICKSRSTGKIKVVPVRALHHNNTRFWEHQDAWIYFLDSGLANAIREREEALRRPSPGTTPGSDTPNATNEAPPEAGAVEVEPSAQDDEGINNFGDTYLTYSEMSRDERMSLLHGTTDRLNDLIQRQSVEKEELAETLVAATQDATMINRATLLEALRLGNDQARAYTREIVVETHRMVKSTMRLVGSDIYDDELVRSVVEKSNGTVVQHMTRVFLSGLEFLLFYNRQVMMRGIANLIRIRFDRDYKHRYRTILPHLHDDYLNLEHVFLGGMKALKEVEINKFATGFLVHDVGKAEDIEYHEGDAAYDRETVERHVKIGYRAVMDKTNYPREAALITGYHHEYYGDPSGYGYFREFLQAYKEANPTAKQDYVMSYTMEPLIDYEVVAYFPAKMLEIVDVYDSLTDPNRRYRSPLSPDEAITLIREQFMEQKLKVDPILFDLFVEFFDTRWG